ncbi:hypothetical protein E2C01_084180 [Portunus trituberculatus]|uniref:Uncharacterized protein n=1 Tax=Portunus trituberculatus TaxID=210409 RepID=A0A5B7J443_PORTR|nr:hypothetical protein [Portunus trituberculatus]
MLNNHIRFSTHYVQHGLCIDDDDEDGLERTVKPLGCMFVCSRFVASSSQAGQE